MLCWDAVIQWRCYLMLGMTPVVSLDAKRYIVQSVVIERSFVECGKRWSTDCTVMFQRMCTISTMHHWLAKKLGLNYGYSVYIKAVVLIELDFWKNQNCKVFRLCNLIESLAQNRNTFNTHKQHGDLVSIFVLYLINVPCNYFSIYPTVMETWNINVKRH